ncbi:hypothetical protein DFH06DRAFT_1150116 [Mycena polygramma]|nr:hypothetical protein DFH06DRAFT_1150116 [Mycena polygramma]
MYEHKCHEVDAVVEMRTELDELRNGEEGNALEASASAGARRGATDPQRNKLTRNEVGTGSDRPAKPLGEVSVNSWNLAGKVNTSNRSAGGCTGGDEGASSNKGGKKWGGERAGLQRGSMGSIGASRGRKSAAYLGATNPTRDKSNMHRLDRMCKRAREDIEDWDRNDWRCRRVSRTVNLDAEDTWGQDSDRSERRGNSREAVEETWGPNYAGLCEGIRGMWSGMWTFVKSEYRGGGPGFTGCLDVGTRVCEVQKPGPISRSRRGKGDACTHLGRRSSVDNLRHTPDAVLGSEDGNEWTRMTERQVVGGMDVNEIVGRASASVRPRMGRYRRRSLSRDRGGKDGVANVDAGGTGNTEERRNEDVRASGLKEKCNHGGAALRLDRSLRTRHTRTRIVRPLNLAETGERDDAGVGRRPHRGRAESMGCRGSGERAYEKRLERQRAERRGEWPLEVAAKKAAATSRGGGGAQRVLAEGAQRVCTEGERKQESLDESVEVRRGSIELSARKATERERLGASPLGRGAMARRTTTGDDGGGGEARIRDRDPRGRVSHALANTGVAGQTRSQVLFSWTPRRLDEGGGEEACGEQELGRWRQRLDQSLGQLGHGVDGGDGVELDGVVVRHWTPEAGREQLRPNFDGASKSFPEPAVLKTCFAATSWHGFWGICEVFRANLRP